MTIRLDGKVALITGIGTGMGRTAALMFCGAGARVVGCDLNDCAETVELAEEAGGAITAMTGVDLGDATAAQAWVDEAAEVYGGVDVLYNNASTQRFGSIEELSVADWDF